MLVKAKENKYQITAIIQIWDVYGPFLIISANNTTRA